MKYEKAYAEVVEFEAEDVIATSDCGFPQWDAEYCDGMTQVVSKSQFGM